jgi:hypothetical protein
LQVALIAAGIQPGICEPMPEHMRVHPDTDALAAPLQHLAFPQVVGATGIEPVTPRL